MQINQEEIELSNPPEIIKRRSSYFEPKYKSTEQMFNIIQQKFFKAKEKINTIIYDTAVEASYDVASLIKSAIIKKNKEGAPFILGLATGSTPLNVYKKLIDYYQNGELSFKNCITFNLDEYYPIQQSSLQSYHRFMKENFFDQIDILPENIHIPDGSLPFSKIDKFCEDYENQIRNLGGIDIQLLGIGSTGHIGFNEPGSSFNSTTRIVYLDKVSTIGAAGDFFGIENVPKKAITMGIQTIFQAKKIIVMAFSESKAKIVQKAIEGPINDQIPASFFQKHGKVQFFVDRPASSELARVKCPWVIKGINQQIIIPFDEKLKLKAVLWLAETVKKPISKLNRDDFEQNGLVQLSEQTKDLKQFLERTMKRLTSTFSNYPIGKSCQKVLIFSPHPDDDVICMGATMKKLCEQNHDVNVCYQTSGNLGVFDHDAIKFAQFAKSFAQMMELKDENKIQQISNEISYQVQQKSIGDPDDIKIQQIKGMIRKTEATSAALTCGVKPEKIFFLDLPFYQTGKVTKSEIQQIDIEKCKQLIEQIGPDYIFAAGDLTDPHGTHRNCLLAILKALEQLKNNSTKDYIEDLQVYLYRGAWQEWEIDEVDIAVPMTPDDLYQKRLAIFKHQSQKDKALFPGSDLREFWQRSEARNKQTAQKYNLLGMIEYEAVEVFANLQGLAHLLKYELN